MKRRIRVTNCCLLPQGRQDLDRGPLRSQLRPHPGHLQLLPHLALLRPQLVALLDDDRPPLEQGIFLHVVPSHFDRVLGHGWVLWPVVDAWNWLVNDLDHSFLQVRLLVFELLQPKLDLRLSDWSVVMRQISLAWLPRHLVAEGQLSFRRPQDCALCDVLDLDVLVFVGRGGQDVQLLFHLLDARAQLVLWEVGLARPECFTGPLAREASVEVTLLLQAVPLVDRRH